MKIVTIIENDPVFGPKYGTKDIVDSEIAKVQQNAEQSQKIKDTVNTKKITTHRTMHK